MSGIAAPVDIRSGGGDRGHRNEIDGLRAVAIVPVLFYHAGVWPFSGGYVGVDVFFVISGYLITGLILREQAAGGGFSLMNFYDRRIRRILPALGAMLAATTVAALFILLPDELVTFGKSLAGSTLFYANILYWLRDIAYFTPEAAQNPLLHVWSLSVEEQFYLLWPLLLIGLARFRRGVPSLIAVLAGLSLALALAYARIDPSASFYLLPARAWQLLLGALLATGRLPPLRHGLVRNLVAVLGLSLVAAAIVLPGGADLYRPFNALGAAFGTMAILYAADGGGNIVGAALATRIPVFIGRISYSLYLWHWPALVLAPLVLDRKLSLADTAAVLVGVFVAATLSWKYIEQPIRRRRGGWRGVPASFPVAAAGCAALIAVALAFTLTNGLAFRVPPDVRAIAAEGAAPSDNRWCGIDGAADCLRDNPAFAGQAVLWGDSHALALAPGLLDVAAARHLRLREFTRSACPPLPGLALNAPNGTAYGRCTAFNRAVLDRILKDASIRLVILQARWEVYLNERRIPPAEHAEQAMANALDDLLEIMARHRIPVLVIGNVPRFPFDPAQCYGRKRMFGRDPRACTAQPLTDALTVIGASDTLIARAVARYPAARAYFPRAALCDSATCRAFAAGHVLYADEHHLSVTGATLIGHAVDAAQRDWPAARAP